MEIAAEFVEIKKRLRKLTENRNYFFKDTTRLEAERYLYYKTNFTGLDIEEIEGYEKSLGISLPEDFRLYLAEFGANCGDLFCCGQDIKPRKFSDYKKYALEIIQQQEIEPFLIPDNLVFWFHQGYVFMYFHQSSVFIFQEGDKAPRKIHDSFMDLLRAEVTNLEKVNEELNKDRGCFLTIKDGLQTSEHPALNSGIKPREVGDVFPDEPYNKHQDGKSWWQKLFSF